MESRQGLRGGACAGRSCEGLGARSHAPVSQRPPRLTPRRGGALTPPAPHDVMALLRRRFLKGPRAAPGSTGRDPLAPGQGLRWEHVALCGLRRTHGEEGGEAGPPDRTAEGSRRAGVGGVSPAHPPRQAVRGNEMATGDGRRADSAVKNDK